MAGEKILLVDDEADLTTLLKTRLKLGGGFEVITASNGKEALEKTVDEKPAVVVTDISMPIMSCLEYLRELVKKGYLKKVKNHYEGVPVIGMSTNSNSTADEMLRNGAYAVIKKPIDDQGLLRTIKGAIEKNPHPYGR